MISHDADDKPQGLWPHCLRCFHLAEGERVLKPLVDSGLLESKKGPTGGYMLARPASEITVLDIVEASEGTINGAAVLPEPNDDEMDNFPNFKPENVTHVHNKLNHLCKQAAETVRKQFEKVKLTDLLKK